MTMVPYFNRNNNYDHDNDNTDNENQKMTMTPLMTLLTAKLMTKTNHVQKNEHRWYSVMEMSMNTMAENPHYIEQNNDDERW